MYRESFNGGSKINKELKAEIIRKYGAQYPFAAELGISRRTLQNKLKGSGLEA